MNANTRTGDSGFTLVELLVVIAVTAMLAVLVLPALAMSNDRGQGARCLGNLRQLQKAWLTYAGDNRDKTVPIGANWNTPGTPADWVKYWCGGTMSDFNNCTNLLPLKDGLLYGYVGTVNVYKCPADSSTQTDALNTPLGVSGAAPRVRSVSVSQVFSPDPIWLPSPPYRAYAQISQIVKPADTWVFIDEGTKSINDSSFAVVMAPPSATSAEEPDYPSINHGGASGMSFADGHSIIHKWLSPLTCTPPSMSQYGPAQQISSDPIFVKDMIWLSSETTVHQ